MGVHKRIARVTPTRPAYRPATLPTRGRDKEELRLTLFHMPLPDLVKRITQARHAAMRASSVKMLW
ncbi:MAG: hypothetical protein JWQ17_2133 [Tardiphaga sp.]|nr:hypothetical protein [Tardiphaga sp.]